MIYILIILSVISYVFTEQDLVLKKDPLLSALENPRYEKPGVDTSFQFKSNLCLIYDSEEKYFGIKEKNVYVKEKEGAFQSYTCEYKKNGKVSEYTCSGDVSHEFKKFTVILHIDGEYEVRTVTNSYFIEHSYNCALLDDKLCPASTNDDKKSLKNFKINYGNSETTFNKDNGQYKKEGDGTVTATLYFHSDISYMAKIGDNLYCTYITNFEVDFSGSSEVTSVKLCHTYNSLEGKEVLDRMVKGDKYLCRGNIYDDNFNIAKIYNIIMKHKCSLNGDEPCFTDSYVIQDGMKTTINNGNAERLIEECRNPYKSYHDVDGVIYGKVSDDEHHLLDSTCNYDFSGLPSRLTSFIYTPRHTFYNEVYTEKEYTNTIEINKNGIKTIKKIVLSCEGSTMVDETKRYSYRHYRCEDLGRSSYSYDNHVETYFRHGMDATNHKDLYLTYDVFFDGRSYYLRKDPENPLTFDAWKFEPSMLRDSVKSYGYTVIIILLIAFII